MDGRAKVEALSLCEIHLGRPEKPERSDLCVCVCLFVDVGGFFCVCVGRYIGW